ncbi:unnamed protein product [Urochloa humidicola]
MAVAISAVAPPPLHGRSRLSRASAGVSPRWAPPLFAGDDDALAAPPFPQGGFLALMLGQCELLSFSEGDFPPPPPQLPLPRERGRLLPAQMICRQQLSLDAALQAPVSEDDVDVLAPMFSQEEIRALRAAHDAPPPPPPFAGARRVKRKSSPAASPTWPSCISDDDDECEDALPPPPPPVKKVRKKIVIRRRDAAARAARLHRKLREWHGTIASRILRRQFRPPEPSRGRTALGCQCHELSLTAGGGGCALHQETREPGDRAWMYTAQGRLPLVGGPGEVLVPTMAAGNSKATVLQHARWRRGVRMPSRFYLESAAQQQRKVTLAAFGRRPEDDDWTMMVD